MAYENSYDVEKNQGYADNGSNSSPPYGGDEKRNGSYVAEDGAVPGEAFIIGDGMRAKLLRFASKFGVEARGIERVPDDERTDTGFRALLNVATMVCARSAVLLLPVC